MGGSEAVIFKRLGGLGFHHGHMFMGGSVENQFGLMFGKNPLHMFQIDDVTDDRQDAATMAEPDEFLFDLEDGGLGAIHQQEAPGLAGGDLAAKLAADATTCARHEDDAVVQGLADILSIQFHTFTAEQILDLDVP